MKIENVLIIGGLGIIAYWLLKKQPKVVDINPPMEEPKKEEAKTIYLDLSDKRKKNRNVFPNSFVRDFDASKFRTVAPPMVVVKESF
jgi:hypothetical protein